MRPGKGGRAAPSVTLPDLPPAELPLVATPLSALRAALGNVVQGETRPERPHMLPLICGTDEREAVKWGGRCGLWVQLPSDGNTPFPPRTWITVMDPMHCDVNL